MKMIKKLNILIGAFLFAFATLVNADTTVSFSDSRVISQAGQTFSLDILISGAPNIEGGGVAIHFRPDLLEVTNVTVDNTIWNFVNKDGDINNDKGSVTDVLFSSFRGVSGDAKIATVEFKSLKRGKGVISLEEASTNPFASGGQKISTSFESTKIKVHNVRKARKARRK